MAVCSTLLNMVFQVVLKVVRVELELFAMHCLFCGAVVVHTCNEF